MVVPVEPASEIKNQIIQFPFLNESHFKILRKCQAKFDCLVFEMLYINKFKPNLNVQADSISFSFNL